MRTLLLLSVAVFALVYATPSAAQQVESDSDTDAVIGPRLAAQEADFAISTQQKDVLLLLRGDSLFMQLTDAGLEDLQNRARDGKESDEDESLAVRVMEGALLGSLAVLFDRSVGLHVAEVDSAAYERGGLRLMAADGDELFDISLNDRDVMEDFAERDARRFIEQLESIKQRARR